MHNLHPRTPKPNVEWHVDRWCKISVTRTNPFWSLCLEAVLNLEHEVSSVGPWKWCRISSVHCLFGVEENLLIICLPIHIYFRNKLPESTWPILEVLKPCHSILLVGSEGDSQKLDGKQSEAWWKNYRTTLVEFPATTNGLFAKGNPQDVKGSNVGKTTTS